MKVYKEISFDAAHLLPYYEGKCHNLHGHLFRVQIGLSGQVDNFTGFVIDFMELKKFLTEEVDKRFDHTYLNNTILNPTAENLVSHIRISLEAYASLHWRDVRPCCVRVWETEDSMVEEEW